MKKYMTPQVEDVKMDVLMQTYLSVATVSGPLGTDIAD